MSIRFVKSGRLNLICYNTMSTFGNIKALMSLYLGILGKNKINLNLADGFIVRIIYVPFWFGYALYT